MRERFAMCGQLEEYRQRYGFKVCRCADEQEKGSKKRGDGYLFIERPTARVLEALHAENSTPECGRSKVKVQKFKDGFGGNFNVSEIFETSKRLLAVHGRCEGWECLNRQRPVRLIGMANGNDGDVWPLEAH
jgi:hypothetical protein